MIWCQTEPIARLLQFDRQGAALEQRATDGPGCQAAWTHHLATAKSAGRPRADGETNMAGKFEITKDKRGEYRFRLKAADGEIIASSEGYKTKASAHNGIESVQKNASDATVVDLTE